MREEFLVLQKLKIGYRKGRRGQRAVARNLNASLAGGEMVCLAGPNGAGKSTLLRTASGALPPLSGHIEVRGCDLSSLAPAELARKMGIVLTGRPEVAMLPVYSLVALGRYPYTGWRGILNGHDHDVVDWALRAVAAHGLAERNFADLSDGERQRVLLARALAQQPSVLLLDEITAFLDLPGRVGLTGLLRDLAHKTGCAVLLSTHDLDLALRTADRLWLLDKQGVLHIGSPEELVLSGVLQKVFASKGIRFDTRTGTFHPLPSELSDGQTLVTGG